MKYLLIAVSIALVAAEGCGKDTYDAFYCFTNKAFCDVPANEKWMSANCAATCCKAAPSGEKVYVRQPGDNALCGNTLKAEGCAESENTRALCPGLCGTTAAWRTPVENTAPVVGKPVVPVVPPLPPKPSVDDYVNPVDDESCGNEYPVTYCPLSDYVRLVCPVMCGGARASSAPKPTPKPAAPTAPAAPTPKPAAPTPKPAAPTAAPIYIPATSDDSSCGFNYPPEYCELSDYVRSVCPNMCAAPAVGIAPAVASDAPAAAPGSSASADVPAPAAASDAPAAAPGSSAGADVPAPSAASNAPAGAPGASGAAVPAPAGPPSGR